MFNLCLRAATVTLLAVIAFLIYNNYIRSAAIPDFQVDHAALESPPELPKLAPAPEIPALPEVATVHETPRLATPAAPAAKRAAPVVDDGPIAEIIDTSPIAEVVELPRRMVAARAVHTAALAVQEEAPVRQAEIRRHTVQSGESLWVIARKYYGNGELYNKVAEANGITNIGRIRAGQVLMIPDLNAQVVRIPEELADHEDTARIVPVSFSRELSMRGKNEIRRK